MTGYIIGLSIGVVGMILQAIINIKNEMALERELNALKKRRIRPVTVSPMHCMAPRRIKGVMVAEHPEEGADLWTDF